MAMANDHFLNLQPGTIVNGRYEVVKCLGTGSMGMVYACRHRELAGHIVAMKVLFSEVARDEIAAARFRNEIVASYGVSHPNVVRAFEYFRDGDLIAFTMEYIGGGDLADKINLDEPIPIPEIIRMLQQMCSGVQAIHDAGIIHRDLKPENILLTAQGDIKITDFGIARTHSGPKLTEHGGVVGTIDYVSPEYLEQGQVDARSDIYALGTLAYEMVMQELPYKGKSLIETMTMRLRSDPEPLHHRRPDCPIALSNIILKAMTRDPEHRYQSAREMLEDLRAFGNPNGYAADNSVSGMTGSHVSMATTPSMSQSSQSLRPAASGSVYGAGAFAGSAAADVHSDRGGRQEPYEWGYTADYRGPASRENGRDNGSHYDQPMESVLQSSKISDWARHIPPKGEDLGPSVAISHGHLSTNRIKELSHEFYTPQNPNLLQTLLPLLLIFFVGFGVGWLLLQQVKPEWFGGTPVVESSTSRGSASSR